VRNLPEERPGSSLMGVSDADMPLQGASTAGIPAVEGELGPIVPGLDGFRLGKKALPGSASR
jgi:hypothetical protein